MSLYCGCRYRKILQYIYYHQPIRICLLHVFYRSHSFLRTLHYRAMSQLHIHAIYHPSNPPHTYHRPYDQRILFHELYHSTRLLHRHPHQHGLIFPWYWPDLWPNIRYTCFHLSIFVFLSLLLDRQWTILHDIWLHYQAHKDLYRSIQNQAYQIQKGQDVNQFI